MSIDHLDSDYIDRIALQLDGDVYGANGDLDHQEILDRLMETIVEKCNHHLAGHSGIYEDFIPMSVEEHAYAPALTLSQAASMILRVWEYMDRIYNELLIKSARSTDWPKLLPENPVA